MRDWWTGQLPRQRVAFGIYGFGVLLMLFTLPLSFYHEGSYGEPRSGQETLWELASEVVFDPAVMITDTWRQFLDGPLPAVGTLVSYVLVLPGLGLLFLASKNAAFCWAGRLFWAMLFIMGPLVFHCLFTPVNAYISPGIGSRLWAGAVALICVAHWVMVPRRLQLPDAHTPPNAG